MIVAEYCQRLLTVLSRRLILHFSFALAVKLSCHFGVGTEIVLPLPAGTSFNVPRTAKEPVQQGIWCRDSSASFHSRSLFLL
jgi:hypothetical protein